MVSLLLVVQLAAGDSLTQTHVVGALGAQVDSQLTRFADSGFSGTVLVVRDRHIVLLKGYGLADAEHGVRNGPSTRFEMNSMTKMFTGVGILQLAGTGRLKVTDPVALSLGEFPEAKRGATIEVVTGTTYENYLREHVFAPAGMQTAVFRNEVPERDTLFARGRVGAANPYVWGTRGAGGVWSTVGDMYRWVVAIEDGVVLPEAERGMLFSPHKPPAVEAYGWHVGPVRIDKGGGSANFASQLLYYPARRTVIIWACNDLRQRWRARLNQALAEIAHSIAQRQMTPS